MNDERDVEQVLASYRPVSPPPGLRDRITAPQGGQQLRGWLALAAALVIAVVVHFLASRAHARVERDVMIRYLPPRHVGVDALASALGGDDLARVIAAQHVEEDRWHR